MREEIRREHEARRFLLELAREAYPWKVTAYKNKVKMMRRKMKLPKKKSDWTAEQRKEWNAYLLESRKSFEDYLIARLERDQAKSDKARERLERKARAPEELAAKEKKRLLREERKAYIKEKYGFRLGKKPETPEEIEGRKRYERDMEAAMRERRRDKIRVYNREYRRKRRAAALAVEQEKWSSEQWAAYNKKMANKAYPKGSPQWLIKEVVCYLAQIQDLPEDAVTARLIELGGMDFLVKGAESMGRSRCANSSTILAAVRALGLYLDPDGAVMFSRGGDAARDEV